MKYLTIPLLVLATAASARDIQSCGSVTIEQVISGPRHGALLNLSNNSCGNSGYVCIDLEGEYSSAIKGSTAYSLALAAHMAGKDVQVSADLDFIPSACGGNYPVVEDIRTKF